MSSEEIAKRERGGKVGLFISIVFSGFQVRFVKLDTKKTQPFFRSSLLAAFYLSRIPKRVYRDSPVIHDGVYLVKEMAEVSCSWHCRELKTSIPIGSWFWRNFHRKFGPSILDFILYQLREHLFTGLRSNVVKAAERTIAVPRRIDAALLSQ